MTITTTIDHHEHSHSDHHHDDHEHSHDAKSRKHKDDKWDFFDQASLTPFQFFRLCRSTSKYLFRSRRSTIMRYVMIVSGEKITVADLPPVARTLLMPLACRARESARPDALLRDPNAEELFARFDGGLDSVLKMKALDELFTVMRARQFDRYAGAFLASNPGGLVVDIGCGLDTRFYRLDNGKMAWLGLDLPEVIGLRRSLLQDSGRCESIACSMLDLAWLDVVAQKQKPVIFLAEGVFPYFQEAEVKKLIMAISARFSGAKMAFDALSPLSVWLHNRSAPILKETGARLNWAVDDARRLEPWGLRLLDKWRYFDQYEPRLGASNLLKYLPPMANMNCILHYRLEQHVK